MWESDRCPNCHNVGTLRPLKEPAGDSKWTEIAGHLFGVTQYRCVACGLTDLVQRDFRKSVENFEPSPGRPAPLDGRMFVVHPISEPPKKTEVSDADRSLGQGSSQG